MRFSLAVTTFFALGLTTQAWAATCLQEAGPEDSKTYVEHCIEVSPATNPPCNAENSCQMIWDEIARGCSMLGNDAPDFCEDYGS